MCGKLNMKLRLNASWRGVVPHTLPSPDAPNHVDLCQMGAYCTVATRLRAETSEEEKNNHIFHDMANDWQQNTRWRILKPKGRWAQRKTADLWMHRTRPADGEIVSQTITGEPIYHVDE